MDVGLNSEKKQIPFSKRKLFLLFIGSLAIVAIGIDFIASPAKYAESANRHTPSYIITIIGLAAISFFGVCGIVIFLKLFDKTPGLIIDEQGIKINSAFKDNLEWEEIEGFGVSQIARTKLIIVYLKNPEAYIEKEKSLFKRKLMQSNYKMSGSPISINSNGLQCNFDELYSLLTSRLNN